MQFRVRAGYAKAVCFRRVFCYKTILFHDCLKNSVKTKIISKRQDFFTEILFFNDKHVRFIEINLKLDTFQKKRSEWIQVIDHPWTL